MKNPRFFEEELRKEDKRVIFLDKVISSIRRKEVSQLGELEEVLEWEGEEALGAKGASEVSGFYDDLSFVVETAKKLEEMKTEAMKKQ